MNGKKLGFALCGSFCTLERTLKMMAELTAEGWEIQPIMSPITYDTDTRFGTAGRANWPTPAAASFAGGTLHRQHAGQARLRHHRYTCNNGSKGASAERPPGGTGGFHQ